MGSICFEEKLFWTFLVRKGIVLFDLGKNRADEKDGGGGRGRNNLLSLPLQRLPALDLT